MCDRAKSSSSEILEDSESTPAKDIKKSKVSEMNWLKCLQSCYKDIMARG